MGDEEARLPDYTPEQVELMKVSLQADRDIEIAKSKDSVNRALVVGATISVCSWAIAWTIVKLTDKPPWLQAIAILVGLGPPSLKIREWYRTFREYMATHHSRMQALEAITDRRRLSSGLNPDGSSPEDD